MKPSSFVPLLLLLTAPLGAQQKLDVKRAVTSDVSIRLAGAIGSLRVIGWDRDTAALSGVVGKGAKFENMWGGPQDPPTRGLKMFIDAPGEAIAAATKLELRVPARARVWIKIGSGAIDVSGVGGGLDLNVIGGSVRVAGDPRELNIESMDGDVTVEGTPAWLRAKTATGAITLKGGGDDVGATSVSGAITVTGGHYERAKFETVTGAIVFAGDPTKAATISFDTHSGPIELRLNRKASVDIDAMTVTGAIENALTFKAAVPGREGRGQEIGFSVSGGDAHFVIRSFKGNIALKAR